MRVAMLGLRAPGAEGGVERVVSELGPRLVRRGCEVTVFTRGRYTVSGHDLGGMRVVDVPTVYTKHLEAIVHTSLAMPQALRGFDVVHLHATGPSLLSFLPRLAGVPTVATVHGFDWRRAKWSAPARTVLRAGAWAAGCFPHAVITVSRETTAHYARRGHKVTFIPNGAPDIPEVPLEEAGVPGLEPGFLLYLGRLVPEKGIEVLLAAHRVSRTSRPLVITGSSGHSEAYARRLREAAGPGVHFTGSRFGRAKAALLHHAGAYVSASRLEGMPLGLLEAMSTGRVCLVSDIEPHRQVIWSEDLGVRIAVDDVDAWARALTRLDEGDFTGCGDRARQQVASDHDWERIADRTLSVYRFAIDRLAGRPLVPVA